ARRAKGRAGPGGRLPGAGAEPRLGADLRRSGKAGRRRGVFAREERTRLDGGVSQGHLRQRARWKGTPAPMKRSSKSLLGRIGFESRPTAILLLNAAVIAAIPRVHDTQPA